MTQNNHISKSNLSLNRHREIGQEIQEMREKFISLAIEIGNVFGHDGQMYKYVCSTILDIEVLREHLDEEVPSQDSEKEDAWFYYRKGESKWPSDALDVQKNF